MHRESAERRGTNRENQAGLLVATARAAHHHPSPKAGVLRLKLDNTLGTAVQLEESALCSSSGTCLCHKRRSGLPPGRRFNFRG